MSSGLFVCMVLWEPFIGCFIGGRLLCGICLTYSRQRPERSRMAIAEGCRLGGFLCPHAERTYGALRLPEITLSGFSRSVFRLFSIVCFARLYYVVGCFCVLSGCVRSFRPIGRKRPKGAFPVIHALFSRLFRMPQIPVLSDSQPPECPQKDRKSSVSQQRDCRRHRREAVETMRPEGRMTAVITAAMSVAAQCSVIRWLPSPARVKRSRGGAGAVSAGVWPGLLVAWRFSEFSVRAGSGGVALPFSRSAGSGAGVSPASEAVADAAVVAASVVAAVGIADASVADGVAAVSAVADGVAVVAACVVAAIGVADASGVFVIVSTVVFADCGGISPLSGSMRRMRWRIWRPSQRNSTTSPGCRA